MKYDKIQIEGIIGAFIVITYMIYLISVMNAYSYKQLLCVVITFIYFLWWVIFLCIRRYHYCNPGYNKKSMDDNYESEKNG